MLAAYIGYIVRTMRAGPERDHPGPGGLPGLAAPAAHPVTAPAVPAPGVPAAGVPAAGMLAGGEVSA